MASILADHAGSLYVGRTMWKSFFERRPQEIRGNAYAARLATVPTSSTSAEVIPQPSMLVGWRPDLESPLQVIHPALLEPLAINFQVFQLFARDLAAGSLPYYASWRTADGKESKLPVAVFTGAELDPNWIPLIIQSSLNGVPPPSGITTMLIGRALGDTDWYKYGSDQVLRFFRRVRDHITSYSHSKNPYPHLIYPLRNLTNPVDINIHGWHNIYYLLQVQEELGFFSEMANMLNYFTFFRPELTEIDDLLAAAYAKGRIVLDKLQYCSLIRYIRIALGYDSSIRAKFDTEIKAEQVALATEEKWFNEADRQTYYMHHTARLNTLTHLRQIYLLNHQRLQAALDAFYEYLQSQSPAYTRQAINECVENYKLALPVPKDMPHIEAVQTLFEPALPSPPAPPLPPLPPIELPPLPPVAAPLSPNPLESGPVIGPLEPPAPRQRRRRRAAAPALPLPPL